jgi:hypothetical protein
MTFLACKEYGGRFMFSPISTASWPTAWWTLQSIHRKRLTICEAPSILRVKIDRLKNVAPIQSEFKTKEIGLLSR